jgi:hypothetical protein
MAGGIQAALCGKPTKAPQKLGRLHPAYFGQFCPIIKS